MASEVNVVVKRKWPRRNRGPSMLSLVLLGLAVGMVSILALMLWLPSRSAPVETAFDEAAQTKTPGTSNTAGGDRNPPQPGPPRTAEGASPGNPKDPISSSRPVVALGPRGPNTMADLMRPADDSTTDAGTVTGRLAAARRAMWSRDLKTAAEHVEAARRIAGTPTERDEVERVARLLDSLSAFWTAVRAAASKLEAADEIHLDGTIVLVVEASRQELTVRAGGRNLTYAVDDLPAPLAVALAERALPRGNATTELSIGAFLAIDARGDRRQARARWEQAGPEGRELLAELALAPALRSSSAASPGAPDSTTNGTALDGRPGASPEPPLLERAPVPKADALTRAEAQIRDLFGNDLQEARSAEQRKSLADRLFDVAVETGDDPAAVYALCLMARDMAVDAGDPESFCRIIDELDRRFTIDALAMKAEAVAAAWRAHNKVETRMALARQSLDLLDAAMRARHYEAAAEFVRAAQFGARGAKNYALVRELEQRERDINASLRKGD